MIFHENHLPADDSHEISSLICFFEKAANLKLSSAANYRWRLKGYVTSFDKSYLIFLTMKSIAAFCGPLT